MEKSLEKIKEIIDFCDAVGCHRAIYESIKFVEAGLEEAMKHKSCDDCRSKSCSVKRILLELGEINPSYFSCNDYEPKDNA